MYFHICCIFSQISTLLFCLLHQNLVIFFFNSLWDWAAEVSHNRVVAQGPQSRNTEFRPHVNVNGGTRSKKLPHS